MNGIWKCGMNLDIRFKGLHESQVLAEEHHVHVQAPKGYTPLDLYGKIGSSYEALQSKHGNGINSTLDVKCTTPPNLTKRKF